jgi:hypothetical protein
MRALTFRERMREEAAKSAAAETADPWRLTLKRVRGRVDFYDGLERISSQTLLDLLEVPQRSRTVGTFRRLAKVMAELGWTAVRVRDLTRGGYREQVRGYCRQPRVKAGHCAGQRRARACFGTSTQVRPSAVPERLQSRDKHAVCDGQSGFAPGDGQ